MSETRFDPRLEQIISALQHDLPPVTLLLGPNILAFGVVLEEVRHHHGIGAADFIVCHQPFTADDARNLVTVAAVHPFSPYTLAVVLTDAASEQAQNILLKLLEEPPPTLRVILIATRSPLPTIVSRARVHRFGVQAREETAVEDATQAKVASAVRAAQAGDEGLLLAACKDFDDADVIALRQWAISQAWAYRSDLYPGEPAEPRVPARTARRVITALSQHPKARPVNAAVAALSLAFGEDGK